MSAWRSSLGWWWQWVLTSVWSFTQAHMNIYIWCLSRKKHIRSPLQRRLQSGIPSKSCINFPGNLCQFVVSSSASQDLPHLDVTHSSLGRSLTPPLKRSQSRGDWLSFWRKQMYTFYTRLWKHNQGLISFLGLPLTCKFTGVYWDLGVAELCLYLCCACLFSHIPQFPSQFIIIFNDIRIDCSRE